MKIKRDVFISDEYYDECADFAYVNIDLECLETVCSLHSLIKRHDLDEVSKCWGDIEFMDFIRDENYERTEDAEENNSMRYTNLVLRVNKHTAYWSFGIKNMEIEGSIQGYDIDTIKRAKKVMTMPLQNLPPYMNDEDELIKEIVKDRLKKGE
jgi:hypothetical protein